MRVNIKCTNRTCKPPKSCRYPCKSMDRKKHFTVDSANLNEEEKKLVEDPTYFRDMEKLGFTCHHCGLDVKWIKVDFETLIKDIVKEEDEK